MKRALVIDQSIRGSIIRVNVIFGEWRLMAMSNELETDGHSSEEVTTTK